MIISAEILAFCQEYEHADIHSLALQASKFPHIDFQLALQQLKGLQVAKVKLPTWYKHKDIAYPIQLSLEQCSSEETALYKQSLCKKGNLLVDLTGGLGVDTSFLSTSFDKAIYVEQQEALCDLTQHNFHILGFNHIDVRNAEAIEFLKDLVAVDLIYIDPARRDLKGKKTVLIEDCTPNLIEIQDMLDTKASQTMIKLSPMLDISLALKSLTHISQVHVVSVHNECKELLFIKDRNSTNFGPSIHCVNLTNTTDTFVFTKEEEDSAEVNYATKQEQYLYEPNTSLMKAGAYKIICSKYGLKKLHPSSHLYTSNHIIEDFPGRTFRVNIVSSLNKKNLKRDLADITQANVATRNFPLKAEVLKKRLKIKDGGDCYIFGTTNFSNERIILICDKI